MVQLCEEEMHRCSSDLQFGTTQNYVDFYILLQFIFILVLVRNLISRLDFLKYNHILVRKIRKNFECSTFLVYNNSLIELIEFQVFKLVLQVTNNLTITSLALLKIYHGSVISLISAFYFATLHSASSS